MRTPPPQLERLHLFIYLYEHGGIFPQSPSHWLKWTAFSPALSLSFFVQPLMFAGPPWLLLLEPQFLFFALESQQVVPMNLPFLSSLSTMGCVSYLQGVRQRQIVVRTGLVDVLWSQNLA